MNLARLVLIGDPVSQSLSPRFQSAAIAAAGLPVKYESLRVAASELRAFAAALAAENFGGNVTVPHKVAFLSLCYEVTPVASRVGAVNTFWSSRGKLHGDNTDVGGFDAAARELLGEIPADLTVAVIGAGGAAAAILGAVESWPNATVRLYARNATRASALTKRFGDSVRVESSTRSALAGAKLIVNATPIGMSDESLPFEIADIPKGAAVLDLVYKRGGTALVRSAQAAGHRAADGTTMLIEQGALSFERWFGFTPDKAVMRAALV